MSLLKGCLAASSFVSVCLSPTFGTFAQVPCGMQGWCCARGNRARQLAKRQVMVVVAAMRRGTGMGQQEGSREENKEGREGRRKKARRKKAKEGWVALEGRSGRDWEMVSSLWVSINSCLGVDLCVLCFSSYCLGILVGTLPAPMLGSHHHPSHSDQRRKETSAE